MKIYIYNLSLFLLSLIVFTACHEEEYGYPPKYGSVYCVEQGTLYVGDTVTLRVQINENGYGSYKAEYTWSCPSEYGTILNVNSNNNNPLEPGVTIKDDMYVANNKLFIVDPFASVPECRLVLKKAGHFSVNMSASFYMSIATEQGGIASGASARAGSITVKAK